MSLKPEIKIFVSCHKDDVYVPKGRYLHPIQVGAAIAPSHFAHMLHDDVGDNISAKNPMYCELTAQYWVWKNVKSDYYGFFHYRRYFNFSDEVMPIHHEPFVFGEVMKEANKGKALAGIGMARSKMRKVICNYDFIGPAPVQSLEDETVYEQYAASAGHHVEDVDVVKHIVKEKYPEYVPAMEKYLNGKEIYCCNMFIMTNELFQQYSAWLFDILSEHEKIREHEINQYPPVDKRVSGYLAERLCGVFITYVSTEGFNGRFLQRVYFKNTEKSQGIEHFVYR